MVVVLASRPKGEFVSVIEPRDRSRVVLVHGDEESPAVELGFDGMAFLPMWGISVKAFTIEPEHAAPSRLAASTTPVMRPLDRLMARVLMSSS